jgi:hypothetical protein
MSYTSKDDVLRRIVSLSHVPDFHIAQELLQSPNTESFDVPSIRKPAEERTDNPSKLARKWEIRLNNMVKQGFALYGCADLVKGLRHIPADIGVFSLVFRNSEMLGHFYFVEKSWEPIGFAIVRTDTVKG